MSVKRSVHSSGLRIVTEEVPSVRSAAVGIWVNVGSRDEAPATAGASHFLEHLLFKGTTSRTALEISSSIESVGGEMNAFTSKEYTCFYARVIDTDLPMAINVVSDLITSSIVSAFDVDAERKVVLEEIAMRDDDPSDQIHDFFSDTYYGNTPIGRPILGTVESIKGMSRNTVFNYYKKKYLPQDLVVAVAGNIKHKRVVAMVEEALSRDNFLDILAAPVVRPNTVVKNTKQQSVALCTRRANKHICSMAWKVWLEQTIAVLRWESFRRPSVEECPLDSSKRSARSVVLPTRCTHTLNNLLVPEY